MLAHKLASCCLPKQGRWLTVPKRKLMITIRGKSRRPGTAVAVAATVDRVAGVNRVSPTLLQQGIGALRRGLTPVDYPQAVIVCDSAAAAAVSIPGIRIIGTAIESDNDAGLGEGDVPCVIGLPDLMQSVSGDTIVIVDGTEGLVHIDPDLQTLLRYQQIEREHKMPKRVYLEHEHLSARTATGEIVRVIAQVAEPHEVDVAINAGADGLVVDMRGQAETVDAVAAAVQESAVGKPIALLAHEVTGELIRTALGFVWSEVLVLLPPDGFWEQVQAAMDLVEIARGPMYCPRLGFGVWNKTDETWHKEQDIPVMLEPSATFCDEKQSKNAMVAVREIDRIAALVKAGARSLLVRPEMVAAAKNMVRMVGLEEPE